MICVCDVEANGLENPTKVWVIVCKSLETGAIDIFREVSDNEEERKRFLEYATFVTTWVGHNWLEYDYPVLHRLVGLDVADVARHTIDTLIISRLVDYSRDGHSIEDYGLEFGFPKIAFSDFSKYTPEMETYCVRDVEICERIYSKYSRVILDPAWRPSVELEHRFQLIVNDLHNNGFAFNTPKARALLAKVEIDLSKLDTAILKEFPPREVLIKEFTPKATKFGTISKSSIPRLLHKNISEYEVGKTYRHTKLVPFNPSSPRQIVSVLNEAGWKPVDKTKTHVELERDLNRLKYSKSPTRLLDIEVVCGKIKILEKFGWKVNEANLATLPADAPSPARTLARRILLESRRRTLVEWLSLVTESGRIHGKFVGIGAWTHRMAHQKPNTANIPNDLDISGNKKLYGKEMRSLWCAPKNRLLVGVDAEGIQLRIFAHYIDDPEFTRSLVEGKKDDKTDPHSLNQRILGSVCKSRAAAKRFIYALLLGAGIGKLAEILGCSTAEAKEALDRLLVRYTGFAILKQEVLPQDGKRGFLIGLDGRKVQIPGDTASSRTHLAMSGYLQCGEAVIMKRACLKWHDKLYGWDFKLVDFVHDEWQTETPNNMALAIQYAKDQAESLRIVGEELGLKCPLAGSYWNDDHHDYTIGVNWAQTH